AHPSRTEPIQVELAANLTGHGPVGAGEPSADRDVRHPGRRPGRDRGRTARPGRRAGPGATFERVDLLLQRLDLLVDQVVIEHRNDLRGTVPGSIGDEP